MSVRTGFGCPQRVPYSVIRGQRARSCLEFWPPRAGSTYQGGPGARLSSRLRSAWLSAHNGCLVRMMEGWVNGSTVRIASFKVEDVREEESFPGARNNEQSGNAGLSQRTTWMATWEEFPALISVLGISRTWTQNLPPRSPRANDPGNTLLQGRRSLVCGTTGSRGVLFALPSRPDTCREPECQHTELPLRIASAY